MPLKLRRLSRHARLWCLRVLGVVFIITGAVIFPLPIPLGLLLIIVGVALLLASSRLLTQKLKDYRCRHPRLNMKIAWAESKLPRFLSRVLRRSSPLYGKRLQKQCQKSYKGDINPNE